MPPKNIKEFFGKPMIAWSIDAAIRSNLFDKVIVSTDNRGDLWKNLINVFEDMRKTIVERLNEFCDDAGLEPVDIGKSWINHQVQEGYVASHRHELSIVSGAYYPIVEEGSAPIVFDSPIRTPRMAEIHNKATDFTANNMEFEPKSGMLILFPSWLYHYSLPNKTAKRITISFNTYHKTS